MAVAAFTEAEVRGTGLSPRHGNMAGGVLARMNAMVALINANETAIALTGGIVEITATPYAVPANVNTVLVDTATIAGASVVNLPAITAAMANRRIIVVDSTGAAATGAIAVTPNGTDEIDGVNAAVSIIDNYGSVALIGNDDGTAWVSGPSWASLEVHEAITATGHGTIRALNATVNLAALAANVLTLNGLVGQQFIIEEMVAWVNAGAAGLNGDVQISVGTTPAGAELMAIQPLGAGMNAAGRKVRFVFAAEQPAIAGNAALDVSITTADTGGGPATATFEIRGRVQA